MTGNKENQAQPLIHFMVERGWICVAVNYELSPSARFPKHLLDLKEALLWIKENIGNYGGDPDFVAVTGGSAGGHLSSLLSLTANQDELQPGHPDTDTSVRACVPFYGIYDFLDRHNVRGDKMDITYFYTKHIMPCPPEEDPQVWDLASPITLVDENTPPFMLIHGSLDSLSFVSDARNFHKALQKDSRQPVVFAELPNTQHAFEVLHSPRTEHTINAVQHFLEYVYSDYLRAQKKGR
jgi:acetyl esterase/lipase